MIAIIAHNKNVNVKRLVTSGGRNGKTAVKIPITPSVISDLMLFTIPLMLFMSWARSSARYPTRELTKPKILESRLIKPFSSPDISKLGVGEGS